MKIEVKMERLDYILSSLSYHIHKKGKHNIHSPFVYDLITNVFEDHGEHAEYKALDKVRRNLLNDDNVIETVDFGTDAKDKEFITYRASVKKLTQSRSQTVRQSHLLIRLVKHFKPGTILEFGTATGLGCIAMALSNPKAKIISMEGCASIASIAETQISNLNINNIELIIGNFNNVLNDVLEKITALDLVFFDGKYRKIAILDYFNHCLAKSNENSVFIFDDIHASIEMEEAWNEIIQNQSVHISLDVFHIGILFFNKGLSKQHFILKY